jgi:hypothetical protein
VFAGIIAERSGELCCDDRPVMRYWSCRPCLELSFDIIFAGLVQELLLYLWFLQLLLPVLLLLLCIQTYAQQLCFRELVVDGSLPL